MNIAKPLFSIFSTVLKTGIGFTTTYLQCAQRVRPYKVDVINVALSGYGHTAGHWKEKDSGSQLPTGLSELTRSQIDMGLIYWRGLGNALLTNQIELGQQIHKVPLQMVEGVRESLDEVQSAILREPVATTLKTAISIASMKLRHSMEYDSVKRVGSSNRLGKNTARTGHQSAQAVSRH